MKVRKVLKGLALIGLGVILGLATALAAAAVD